MMANEEYRVPHEGCRGLISYKKTERFKTKIQFFYKLDEKKGFYEICSKDTEKIKISIWSDERRSVSELDKIVGMLE